MVYIYCTLIINQRRTFDSIPVSLQNDVRVMLSTMGYGTDGKKLV